MMKKKSDLGLDPQSARELSPIHLDPRLDVPLLLAAGANETSEFIRQSRGLWQSWPRFCFQAGDGIRFVAVTGVQTCALPISDPGAGRPRAVGGHAERRRAVPEAGQ